MRCLVHFLLIGRQSLIIPCDCNYFMIERKISETESAIAELEDSIAHIERQMSTPEGASDMTLLEKHRSASAQLEKYMQVWEQAMQELENI